MSYTRIASAACEKFSNSNPVTFLFLSIFSSKKYTFPKKLLQSSFAFRTVFSCEKLHFFTKHNHRAIRIIALAYEHLR